MYGSGITSETRDQAMTLRRLAGSPVVPLRTRRERAIAVTGGKGGVGKSTVALNLAAAYARLGAQPLAVDTDLGMADLNLLLGVAPRLSLHDVARGHPIDEILVEAHGIHLLPALNGSDALESMSPETRQRIFTAIESLNHRFDTLIIDIAAGIGQNQTVFAGAVPDTLIVATPEPLSLADAYSCIKVLALRQGLTHAFIVPNQVRAPGDAEEVVSRLSALVGRFLDVSLTALPAIPYDASVQQCAESGIPLLIAEPDRPASRAIRRLARRLDTLSLPDEREGVVRLFWKRALAAVEAIK